MIDTVEKIQELQQLGVTGDKLVAHMQDNRLGYRLVSGELVPIHPCAPKDYCGPVAPDGWPICAGKCPEIKVNPT